MSYTCVSKSSELSDSDSDNSCQTRRHPYNTRLSTKSSNVQQSCTPKRVNRTRRSSPYKFRKINEAVTALSNNNMDYCCQPGPPLRRIRNSSPFCTFLLFCFYLLLLAGAFFVIYSQYLITKEVGKLKEDITKMKGGPNRREDPHAKLSQELDKKCSETLKLLLKDPVGRPDFALESSGGKVLSVEAAPYSNPKSLFGFSLCEGDHGPSSMIQATTAPGQCWAFKGQTGKAVLQLIDYVLIDSVTLEHIPPTISPSGGIDSAPKDFKLWGLEKPNGAKLFLGEFRYTAEGGTVQTFNVNNVSSFYKYVEFEIVTNHGNKDFTCVYRIRLHGTARKYG
ncbi:SUN domain-containing protein 3 isoform X2 [Tribolium castaneum]|uniref:SUN domain-containing protein 3 isoform X2 n=1 Tax=Tribolium castaneum TaxID=7070 RepID=UPI00077D9534|nr:PREDICTED: SUN domain-containing protein 3 isoform X2 [Tribolium castaneum]|eukprot:XP_015838244.1 PREDICTED: SUN domain-containing protein 3 isoform X2 [Tribolium castaneum]